MKIIVAGGSGFLGSVLVKTLTEANHTVVILSRGPEKAKTRLPASAIVEPWDAATTGSWAKHVDGAYAIINLTGESIGGKRWTQKQKELIRSSRINSTRAIVDAIRYARQKPKVLVNQSAVGYYGNVEFVEVAEDHPAGVDFLSDVAREWEAEARKAEKYGVRVVLPRTGVVLSTKGGALPRMLLPFRLFAGGPLGSGNQGFPWIHLDDEIHALIYSTMNEKIRGPVNLAAPEFVTTRRFCSELGKAMKRPSWAPVPGFALKVILGEMAGPLLLSGQRIIPRKLLESGFTFKFPRLSEALQDSLQKGN